MLAPHAPKDGIAIDGPRYEDRGAWGHLLNAHYLRNIARCQPHAEPDRGAARDGQPYTLINPQQFPGAEVPRLYRYLHGDDSLG